MNQDLKKTLWAAADKLRSSMDAAEYKHLVLGLIFLKYISDAFDERRAQLQAAFADPAHELHLPDTADHAEALWAGPADQARGEGGESWRFGGRLLTTGYGPQPPKPPTLAPRRGGNPRWKRAKRWRRIALPRSLPPRT